MARTAAPDHSRLTGKVKRLVVDKGFGFIAAADGIEYFFHQSAIPEFHDLREGDAVTFVASQGQKGPRAESVTRA